MGDMRWETGQEKGDRREETCDRRMETGDERQILKLSKIVLGENF